MATTRGALAKRQSVTQTKKFHSRSVNGTKLETPACIGESARLLPHSKIFVRSMGAMPGQRGYESPVPYALDLVRALGDKTGVEMQVTGLNLVVSKVNAELGANDTTPNCSGFLLRGPEPGQRYLVINEGTHPAYSQAQDRVADRQTFSWHILNEGQFDVLQHVGAQPIRLAKSIGGPSDDPGLSVYELRRRIGEPQYQRLRWHAVRTAGRPGPGAGRLHPNSTPPQASTESQSAEITVRVADRVRPAPALIEAYRGLPDAPFAPETLILAFGANGHNQLQVPERLDYVDITPDEAQQLLQPQPFFVSPNGMPNPALVPFAYQLDVLAAVGAQSGIRWQAFEQAIAGHGYSIAGVPSQLYGFDRNRHEIPAAYLTVYADAVLQIFESPAVWERMLNAQNTTLQTLDGTNTAFTSASVYVRNDAGKSANAQLIPDWARGEEGFLHVDLLAQQLAAQAALARSELRTGSPNLDRLDQIMALAEMGNNNLDTVGLMTLLRQKLVSGA